MLFYISLRNVNGFLEYKNFSDRIGCNCIELVIS